MAFLDIAPSSPFHTLVIPKLHARYMHELGSDHASYMYQAIPKIAGAVFVCFTKSFALTLYTHVEAVLLSSKTLVHAFSGIS